MEISYTVGKVLNENTTNLVVTITCICNDSRVLNILFPQARSLCTMVHTLVAPDLFSLRNELFGFI